MLGKGGKEAFGKGHQSSLSKQAWMLWFFFIFLFFYIFNPLKQSKNT
jgi:hypothetical protein